MEEMKNGVWISLLCCAVALSFTISTKAQNRNFIVNLALGAGNSGFQAENENGLKRIFYPTGGLQFQKRISANWAINVYPSVGMSGNRRVLDVPMGNVREVKSTSAFINLALHPKYYLSEMF